MEPLRSPSHDESTRSFAESSAHAEALDAIKEHLAERWQQACCHSCEGAFYKKPSNQSEICGTLDCTGSYEFIEAKPARKAYMDAFAVHEAFDAFFDDVGYVRQAPVPLAGHAQHTIFTGTAGQVFDEAIFKERPFDTQPRFVVQPVVRMQKKTQDGFMKSFVNVSLEQLGATSKDHLSNFENYLDFISRVGIYGGDLTLKVYEDECNWGNGDFNSAVIGVYNHGLEIGVLNYFTGIPQSSRSPLTMSDVSFGLERITWALNRNPRFIDVAGPTMDIVRQTPHDVLDAHRTLTLMLQSGIQPERNTPEGSKLKSLFLSSIPPLEPIRHDLIQYYDQWWRKFNARTVSLQEVISVWERQVARMVEEAFEISQFNLEASSPEEVTANLARKGIIRAKGLGRLNRE
jgi:hypothetical protein